MRGLALKAMGRVRSSIEIVKASWAVLRQDPELLWLPVFSALSTIVAIAIFGGGIAATTQHSKISAIGWVLVFGLYLVMAIITIFFNASLVSAAAQRLQGGDPTLGSALSGAASLFHVLLPWAIVSATVSTILRAIEQRAGLVGRIVAGLIGIAWALVTFLVIPIIVIEGLSVGAAVKRSKELFTRTWGEQVVGNAGIGIISFFAVLCFAPIPLLCWATGNTAVTILGLVLAGIWIAIVGAISAALSGIFQTALYLYASTGQVPGAYTPAQFESAFRPKKSRGFLG